MTDHHISKFFETLFWIGAFLVFASFFYPRWFIVTLSVGIALMVITIVREGVRLRRAKTFVGIIQKNEPKIIHRLVIIVGVIIASVFMFLKKELVYNLLSQFYDLTQSIGVTWFIFVLIGIIIGTLILFVILKLIRLKNEKIFGLVKSKLEEKINPKKEIKTVPVSKKIIVKKEKANFFTRLSQWWEKRKTQKLKAKPLRVDQLKKVKEAAKTVQVSEKIPVKKTKLGFLARLFWEEESFWRKLFKPLSERLEKRKVKKLEQKKASVERLRQEKLEKIRKKVKKEKVSVEKGIEHPLLPRILISLFIIAITVILVLHKIGKFSIENPVSAAALGLIIGLFILYIFINVYKVRKNKKTIKAKKEEVVLKKIKKEIVAKASKYETDLDKLYKLINEVGSLTITEVAEGFGISKEQAEEWGRILEDHNLIEINYPAIGELQLCKKKSKNTQ